MAKSSGSKSLNLAKRAQRNAKQQALKSLALKTAKSGLLSSAIKPAKTMTLSEGLTSARQALMDALAREPSGQLLHVFISLTDGSQRAKVVKASGYKLDDLWLNLTEQLQHRYGSTKAVRWLRVDWARHLEASTWADLALELKKHKRNYFRKGIALDAEMDVAFLEQEINANAMLYAGNSVPHAQVNQANFARYAKQRYSNKLAVNFEPSQPVYTFTTQAILIEANKPFFKLYDYAQSSGGRHTGRRVIERLDAPAVETLINDASQFLAAQVQENGSFIYGLHPCFDREINTYNTLRHTSSIYSMLEAWEITRSKTLKRAIDNALKYLTTKLLRTWTHKEESVTYLVEINNEIKLGGSGVALLALSKYTELTEDKRYLPLMEQIALGIRQLQDPATGGFTHVLNATDLSVKDPFRIIYYDGEAAFGLMRLYGLTQDDRWLAVVEKAFEYFIAKQHWKAHDHWLSYCVNELTLYRPEERYYRFGIQNVAGYLAFVEERITTFPTLLELMMAAHKMITRLQQQAEYRHLLELIDLKRFYHALETRAHYLLNGHFWPEYAMYFQNPQRIVGSFFIRHHSFRVRIDDVEHYLSGFVAYLQHYLSHPSGPVSVPPMSKHEGSAAASTLPSLSKAHDAGSVQGHNVARIIWGGDVNLGRRQHYRTQQLGAEQVLNLPALKLADLAIVNLECVVANSGEQGVIKGEGGPYYYRARPEMLEILIKAGVSAVATANNHSGDYGPEALIEQSGWLDKVGIAHAGTGLTLEAALTPTICAAGNYNVALFSLDATQHRYAATDKRAGSAYLSLKEPQAWLDVLKPRIELARQQAEIVLVAVHWGANLALEPDADEVAVGHAIIDAGADAVLGASAHRLQGIEVYRQRPIIHDAGDLLFDSVRNNFASGALFELEVTLQGVSAINVIPVGVGFGFSRQLMGSQALSICQSVERLSRKLGTTAWQTDGERCRLVLETEQHAEQQIAIKPLQATPSAEQRMRALKHALVKYPLTVTNESVPAEVAITPVTMSGLMLLGVRVSPNWLKWRRMIWIETWWKADHSLSEDLRLDYRAIPKQASKMPAWGRGMDHDPCDWRLPTSRWEVGSVYRDFYGLRPPMQSQLENGVMQLEIRVLSGQGSTEPYLFDNVITLALPSKTSLKYRTTFPSSIAQAQLGETWTAAQLATITGGRWLVEPSKDWFIRSIVNGTKHIGMRPGPTLFVAHTNHDRKLHEGSTQPVAKLGDRHQSLPGVAKQLAGSIVNRPVKNLPNDFPLLLVEDPIKALIEIGWAARQRFTGPVIAVTGTAGKSSTIGLLETLFDENSCLKSIDNYNSRVGVPTQLASLSADHQAALIEIAQSALWMQRGPITRQVRPTIALVTEIGLSQTDHMVKDLEDVAKWKSRVFDGLTEGGTAIIGEHLACYEQILAKAQQHSSTVITFGKSPIATLRVNDITLLEGEGSKLNLSVAGQSYCLTIPFSSMGMIHNCLAVLAVAHALGKNLSIAAQNFSKYQPEEGRLKSYLSMVNNKKVLVIDDSWNAVVLSMLNAFSELKRRESKGRKVAILGRIVHLGDMAPNLHASLAEPLLDTGVDVIITHGEEMHYMREKLPRERLGPHFDNAAELQAYLENNLQNNDLVLLKGSRRNSDFGKISTFFNSEKMSSEQSCSLGSSNEYGGILRLLSQDPDRWATFMQGEWVIPLKKGESIQNIAYLPTLLTANSLVVPKRAGRDFGLTSTFIKKNRSSITAIIGTEPTPPIEGVAYLRVPGTIPSLNKLAAKSRELFNGKVIAVTGSAGKSSTCHMLERALESLVGTPQIAGTKKNENLQLGIMRALCAMSGEEAYAVLEVAAGHAQRCSQMSQPHIAVFTNVSYAHAELYGSLENIADRKAGLFDHMVPSGIAVICRDIPLYERIANHATSKGANVLSYGLHSQADIKLNAYDPDSGEVEALTPVGIVRYVLKARGEHFVSNSLAVLAVIAALKLDTKAMTSLNDWQPLDGRGAVYQLVLPGDKHIELIDEAFNAAPIAMEAALRSLANRSVKGRKVAVLGPMHELGAEEIKIHTDMAALIATLPIDCVHIYGEQYRDFWDLLPVSKRGIYAKDINALSEAVQGNLQTGDVLLCKGSHASRIHSVVTGLQQSALVTSD